ncbi:calcium-binding protein [Actinoplanes sp. CA-142083]|uniref:calcium-binding protein n=1 Tax=Actinoplanes sp. CA-142083 TaxID=3239903 RepID=UPI003D8E488D
MRPLWLVLPTALSLGLLAMPAPAQAAATGVASVSSTTVSFGAAARAVNNIVITRSGLTVTIDDRVAIRAGKGCKAVKGDRTKVRCTTAKTAKLIQVWLSDSNDTVANRTAVPMRAFAGAGNDRIYGGSGADILYGEAGADGIWAGNGNDVVYGGSGSDGIDGGAGNDRIYGQDGNDTSYGGSGNDGIDGGTGIDRLFGRDGNDALYGQDGDDSLDGEAGNDRVEGGNGADTLVGHAGDDYLNGAAGDDMIYGSEGNDVLYGGPGTNQLSGNLGNDRVYGGPGLDDIREDTAVRPGQADADLLSGGGSAHDEVTYAGRNLPVTADADGVSGDDGQAGERDTIAADIDAIIGGNADDRLYASATGTALVGGPGNDTLEGGPGNDYLEGAAGRDHLDGRGGDDTLKGDAAQPYADVILGGDGRDLVDYRDHNGSVVVDLDGEAGDDGAPGEGDTVGADVEDLMGSYQHADRLTGNELDNRIDGYGGGDVIYGLGGNDTLLGGGGGAFLYGGDGDDVLWGHAWTEQPIHLDGGEGGDQCVLGNADPAPDEWVSCERF